ncbi:hypothetical protein NPIL_77611 [Nephila pilipes]|uniref:Uncharacterized protein n=1 Tax=Nephila pilipes TaxID=299642 RepID=A0A8X6R7Y6_NEPPI|nr:hypothetical protein NPIL_77611 [Nephila pilipes]
MINSSTKRTPVVLGDAPQTNHSPLSELPSFPERGRTIITVHSCHKSSPFLEKTRTIPEVILKPFSRQLNSFRFNFATLPSIVARLSRV